MHGRLGRKVLSTSSLGIFLLSNRIQEGAWEVSCSEERTLSTFEKRTRACTRLSGED